MALITGDEIIEMAMQLEESGEAFYLEAAENATSAAVRDLFADLAVQERHHRRAFQQMGRGVVELVFSDEQWDQFQAYTGALLQQRFRSSPEGALGQAAKALNEKDALAAALAFEKETLLFFYELREVVRGADRQVVEQIISEEKAHIQRLSAFGG
jgi:rubrerythrin